jgi:hypothetical protein
MTPLDPGSRVADLLEQVSAADGNRAPRQS